MNYRYYVSNWFIPRGQIALNIGPITIIKKDWFNKASQSNLAWGLAYKDLELTYEEEALGDAAKLMTLMNIFQENEEYEKCAIIKDRMNEVNRILKKKNK